jgi:hypothetical protein
LGAWALVALGALAAAAALSGTAPAKKKPASGLHNARYCEIFVLKGSFPSARLVVWNTIGLNKCPARKWGALDETELAAELGASIVVFNGPRHFLMDSASAKTGRLRSFGGLEMRKVATIPIAGPADLVRKTYAPRTIDRCNVWRWKRGRRVYELRAPDGKVYVMQAYSQIVDPTLKIRDLRSLGDRLELPDGWRYKVRRVKRGLTLKTRGKATIIQDELQNTYEQRKPRPPKTGC